MSEIITAPCWFDGALHIKNRNEVPFEELVLHLGKHVTWNLDGTRILASANDLASLLDQLTAMGIRGGQFVHDFLDDPNEGFYSGHADSHAE